MESRRLAAAAQPVLDRSHVDRWSKSVFAPNDVGLGSCSETSSCLFEKAIPTSRRRRQASTPAVSRSTNGRVCGFETDRRSNRNRNLASDRVVSDFSVD